MEGRTTYKGCSAIGNVESKQDIIDRLYGMPELEEIAEETKLKAMAEEISGYYND